MTIGKEIGDFTLNITSMNFEREDDTVLVHANLEGPLSGAGIEGTVAGTATFDHVGATQGTYDWCGASYLPHGDVITGVAHGSFHSVGANKWRTLGINHLSDGRTVATEGEIELASRTWSGKLFEWS